MRTRLAVTMTAIGKTVSDEMNSGSTTWKGMSDSQVKTLVINTRSRENVYQFYLKAQIHSPIWLSCPLRRDNRKKLLLTKIID